MGRCDRFFALASAEAEKSDMFRKHGAVLVRSGKVVAVGHNSSRSRVHGSNVCSTHAEVHALSRTHLSFGTGHNVNTTVSASAPPHFDFLLKGQASAATSPSAPRSRTTAFSAGVPRLLAFEFASSWKGGDDEPRCGHDGELPGGSSHDDGVATEEGCSSATSKTNSRLLKQCLKARRTQQPCFEGPYFQQVAAGKG